MAKINQLNKSTKDALVKSEEAINKLTIEKDSSEKELNKKLNAVVKERNAIEKQYG